MTYPLAILIPTVVDREDNLEILLKELYRQRIALPLPNLVQFQVKSDNKEMTIGEKREFMYKESIGEYSWQIDDDDTIAPNAIVEILKAIESKPDCVTFEEYVNIDGKEYKSNHSLQYVDWEGDGHAELWDGFHFHRTPFFKSVIKTDIAKSVPIPYIRFGEDHQWAQSLKQHLKTEIHIQEQLYRYIHISTPHNERYGIEQ